MAALFGAGLKKNVASRDGLFTSRTLQKLEKWNEGSAT
jgi:hypothetical protein